MTLKKVQESIQESAGKLIGAAKPIVGAATQEVSTRAQQVSEWWTDYRSKNPKADLALTRIGTALEDIQDRLDNVAKNVSGEAALAEAQALMDKQRRYNDVLATRLAEALERIEALEVRLASDRTRK